MKKFVAFALIASLMIAVVGCGSQPSAPSAPGAANNDVSAMDELSAPQESVQMPAEEAIEMIPDEDAFDIGMGNPIEPVESLEEAIQKSDVPFQTPEGVSDVTYNIIHMDNAPVIAEMNFTSDGKECMFRTTYSMALDVNDVAECDISGLYLDWDQSIDMEVCDREAVYYSDGNAGMLVWLDVVPGIVYNVAMFEGATPEALLELAEAAFVAAQE